MKLSRSLGATVFLLLNVRVFTYSQQEPFGFLSSASSESIVERPEGLPVKATGIDGEAQVSHVHVRHVKDSGSQDKVLKTHPELEHRKEHHEDHGVEKHHAHHEHHPHHEEHAHHEEHGHHEVGGEHGHGEHGHGHHELSAEEEALEIESFSIALFLMGGVGSLMVVFYLVNSPYVGVKVTTWRVLNMTASIFVAVLLYGTLKMVILSTFEPGFEATIAITLTLFVIFFVGTHAILFHLKTGDKMQLQAAGTIMAHISGFAAMYGFADCQEVEMFEKLDAQGLIMLIVGAAVVICGLAFIMDKVMMKIAMADGVQDESEEEWIDTCEETDDDVFCLAISFLTVLFVRYLIRGKVYPYEPGKIGTISQGETNTLLSCAFCFLALACGGAGIIIKYQNLLSTNKFDRRITTNLQHLNSMIMAWSFLFWAEWQLYVWGWESTVIGGCLVVAVFLTVASFGCVFLLNCVQSHFSGSKMAMRAMGSLELALGVLVGFSWERAFDVGFEEIEHTLAHRVHIGIPAHVSVVLMSIFLLIIVAPAWRYYILPKSAQMEKLEES
jgi:hypothetical protein